MSGYERGDAVTVRGLLSAGASRTAAADEECVMVVFDTIEGPFQLILRPSDIATHTKKPRPIEVGDQVRHKVYPVVMGVVQAIAEGLAWVRCYREDERDLWLSYALTEIEHLP